jgi:GxxExxY protein
MDESLFRAWSGKVVGAYQTVYSNLPHSYPGLIYENAMMHVLRSHGLRCRHRPSFEITYRDQPVGAQQLGIVMAEQIVITPLVVPRLRRVHMAQTYAYMRITNSRVGSLLNFGSRKPEFMRLAWDTSDASRVTPQIPASQLVIDMPHPQLTETIVDACIEVYGALGPGFLNSVYGNACHHELWRRGIKAEPHRHVQIYLQGEPIGQLNIDHIAIDDRVMLFPVSVADIEDVNVDSLEGWIRQHGIQLGIVANFYDSRLHPHFITESGVHVPGDTPAPLEPGTDPITHPEAT